MGSVFPHHEKELGSPSQITASFQWPEHLLGGPGCQKERRDFCPLGRGRTGHSGRSGQYEPRQVCGVTYRIEEAKISLLPELKKVIPDFHSFPEPSWRQQALQGRAQQPAVCSLLAFRCHRGLQSLRLSDYVLTHSLSRMQTSLLLSQNHIWDGEKKIAFCALISAQSLLKVQMVNAPKNPARKPGFPTSGHGYSWMSLALSRITGTR